MLSLLTIEQFERIWYMFSFRGDAHKIYLRLKRHSMKHQDFKYMKKLKEIAEIQNFYNSIDSTTLKQVYYCMVKEKNGSGIIPILVSSIPWLLFMFTEPITEILFKKEGSILWVFFVLIYIVVLFTSVFIHFHENSWASVHIEIIQEILKKRELTSSSDKS